MVSKSARGVIQFSLKCDRDKFRRLHSIYGSSAFWHLSVAATGSCALLTAPTLTRKLPPQKNCIKRQAAITIKQSTYLHKMEFR